MLGENQKGTRQPGSSAVWLCSVPEEREAFGGRGSRLFEGLPLSPTNNSQMEEGNQLSQALERFSKEKVQPGAP